MSLSGGARDDAGDHVRAQYAAPLRDENERAGAVVLQLAQAGHLVAVERMHAVIAAFGAENMDGLVTRCVELKMGPLDMARFGGAQAVAIHQAQQYLIAQAVASHLAGYVDHPVGLLGCQIISFGNMRTYTANRPLHHRHHPAVIRRILGGMMQDMRNIKYKSACLQGASKVPSHLGNRLGLGEGKRFEPDHRACIEPFALRCDRPSRLNTAI